MMFVAQAAEKQSGIEGQLPKAARVAVL